MVREAIFVRGSIRPFLILLFITINLPKAVFAQRPCHIYIYDDSPLPQASYVGHTALGTYILRLHPGIKIKGNIKQYDATLVYPDSIRLEHVEGAGFCAFDVNNKVTLNAYSNEECKFRLSVTSSYPATISADIMVHPGKVIYGCKHHIDVQIIDPPPPPPPPPSPDPQFSSITPSSGIRGDYVFVDVSKLEGSFFDAGAQVRLVKGPHTINAIDVNIVNPTRIAFSIPLTATTPVGPWDVLIINSSGKSITQSGAFIVEAPKPTVTGLSVHQGPMGGVGTGIRVIGTDFIEATKVSFGVAGDVTGSGFSVVSGTEIIVTPPVYTSATNAIVDVTVTTPGGTSAVNQSSNQFTYITPPTVTAITQNVGSIIQPTRSYTITGTGFIPDSGFGVELVGSGATINVTAVSATQITCMIDLSSAAVGLYDVRVTNSDKQTGTLYKGFVINNNAVAAPNIGTISPNNGAQGTTVDGIVLKGINFVNGATVQLINGSNTIDAKVAFVSPTQLTCSVTLGTVTGFWDVVVTNPDGQIGLLTQGFIVNKDASAPTISSITNPTPAAGTQGTTITGVTLEGANFATTGAVQLQQAGVVIPANIVSVIDGKHITCNITPPSTASGLWDVTVINPDGQIATLAKAFQVNLKWKNHFLGSKAVTGVYALGSSRTTAIYAATNDAGGIWISLNNAASWIHRTSGNSGLASDGVNGIYALISGGITTIYAATKSGLSVSTNVGASWTNYLLGNVVAEVYALDNHVYAVTTDHLFVSNDNGTSWTNHLSPDSAIAVSVATAVGLFTGCDNTTSWKCYLQDSAYKFYISGNNIYLATKHGLFVSADNGATWADYTASSGLADDIVNGVYVIDNYIYVATNGGLSITSGGP